MLVEGAVIFTSLATAFDAFIPIVFFCSKNEVEKIERFADSRTRYHVVNEV